MAKKRAANKKIQKKTKKKTPVKAIKKVAKALKPKKKVAKIAAKKVAKKVVAKKVAKKIVAKKVAKKAVAKKKTVEKIAPIEKKADVVQQKAVAVSEPAAAPAPKPAPKKRKKRITKAQIEAIKTMSRLSQKWASLYKKTQDVKPQVYSMKKTFEPKTPIMHKVLGWGYVMDNQNDRLEVLFKDGVKFLISNYKA